MLLAMHLSESPERRAGIAKYATEAGWILDARLAAFMVHGRETEYLATIRMDGIISMMQRQTPFLRDLVASARVPVVDMWYDHPEIKCPRVLLDHAAIGRAGAEHLMDQGLRRLLFYSHSVDRRVATIRWNGFRDASAEKNIKASELWWDPDEGSGRGENRLEWLARSLLAHPGPLGVMSVNDAVASEVLEAALLAKLRVPEDVAVVGVDNDPIVAELGTIPLSSVDISREHLGYRAAELLDGLMDGKPPTSGPVLIPPAGVVMRRSTEVIAVADTTVARAARYIRDHFREPITVADVAASSPLSRRRLQDLFQTHMGHGIHEEILRQRLNFSQQMLLNTAHKIERIARMSGFGTGVRMSKVYKRELRTSPQQYRLAHRPALRPNH